MEKELALIDFSKVKKKRMTKKTQKFDIEDEFADVVLDDLKNKTTTKAENKENVDTSNLIESQTGAEGSAEGEYSYDYLLGRILDLITKHNPQMTEKTKISIPFPQVARVSSTRTGWLNFLEVCNALNRSTEHIFQFFLSEFGTEGSLTAESQFLIKGRKTANDIQNLLMKYVMEYVQCQNCKRSNTVLKKDVSTRLQTMDCLNCGSNRTVAAIKKKVS